MPLINQRHDFRDASEHRDPHQQLGAVVVSAGEPTNAGTHHHGLRRKERAAASRRAFLLRDIKNGRL